VSGGLIEWGLAERLARTVAGTGDDSRPDDDALQDTCAQAAERVIAYTQLRPRNDPPRPEAIGRSEWTANALATIRELAGDLDQHAAAAIHLPGPLGGMARGLLGAGAAGEAGTVVGLAARRVLGQYDISLVDSGRRPRLLFVWPNLLDAERQLGAAREPFLHWIALHETTHAVQFGAVEWLRPHLGGLVSGLIEASGANLDRGRVRGAAGSALRADPRRIASALLKGELVRMLASPEQRALLDRAQATMAVIEGHAEHVMDEAARGLGPQFTQLRARLEERREGRSGLEAIVGRLLGMEMKLRQYRLGKAFCDEVVASGGIEALNRVWSAPAALPDLAELEEPLQWLRRVEREAQAPVS
jgi:coenzyme F420 biosynthesis associated uncharacterized protein